MLTTLPYLAGVLSADETWHFAGFVIAAEDGYSYLAKMRQGYDGRWLWQLTYTHEPHTGGPFFLFYLVLGKVCRIFGLSLATGFQLARVAGGLFLGWAISRAANVFVKDPIRRKFTCWIALFGGGWGWLWVILGGRTGLGAMPTDLWVPDGYAWYATLIAPHYAVSQAFLLLALRDGARFLDVGAPVFRWRTALWTLLCVLIHPYSALTIGLVLGLWLLRQRWGDRRAMLHQGMQLLAVVLPSVPYLAWIAWLFLRDPVFSQWARAVQNLSPSPVYYLVGYGSLLVLATMAFARRRWTASIARMTVWIATVSVLLYAPTSSQRRFLSGLEFPIAALAAEGLAVIDRKIKLSQRWRRLLARGLLASMAMTPLFILAGATATMPAHPSALFVHKDERALYRWLAARASAKDVILASDEVSSRLPAYAAARVVWGTLEPETLDAERKGATVRQFYTTMSERERKALLCAWTVTYVVWGPREKAMGTFDPSTAPYLHQAGAWDDWTLWAVEAGLCDE